MRNRIGMFSITTNRHRVKTPTVLQMEAVECGAAALASVLHYYGKYVPLEELRIACGISRDGSKASNILKAARTYGLVAKGYSKEPEQLKSLPLPLIIHWKFNHFLVVDGFGKDKVFLNDPSSGPLVVSAAEFDQSYTGIVLTFEPGNDFKRSGQPKNVMKSLQKRISGSEIALVYVVLAGFALVIPGLVIPIFTKIFVDEILIKGLQNWIAALLIAMTLTALMRGALTWIQGYYLTRFETKLALTMSNKFLWHVLHLPVEFFSQRFAGEIGTRVGINDRVAQLISGELSTTIINTVMIVFYAIIMFQYDVVLTLVGILVTVLNIVALKFVARKRVDANQKFLQDRGKTYGLSISGLQMIETLKASGAESDFFTKWAGYQARMINSQQQLDVYTRFLSVIPMLLSAINTAIILGLGGLRVMNGAMSMGMLAAFQSLMSSFTAPVNRLVNLGATMQEVEGDLNRLDDVLNFEREDRLLDDGWPHEGSNGSEIKLSGELELRNITFGYSRLDAPLIEDFNLTVKPGERVALVGGSGSGKSTLAKIICGLYKPWSGDILFDGQAIDGIARTKLNNSLAMVDQDIFLFEGSIRENLTLWDASAPEINLIQAAKEACIYDEITQRPDAFDGHLEEMGANFSGGQRQRLEIARALTSNPSILVLDEATSALDPLVEKMIDDHLRRKGCTCIIVAHRLSTIKDCDEIIVLDHGKVIQRGTHEEMKNEPGPYSKLIEN